MAAAEIASAAERSLTSQAALLTTLSLAVIGGLLAVLVQVRVHNATSGNQRIDVRRMWLMWVSMAGAGAAICLSYAISGMLIEMSPQIFSHVFDESLAFSKQTFGVAPVGQLQLASLIQFLVFLISIVFGVFFVFSNRRP